MSRFIIFTKTNWDEFPRLRHQLAELLLGDGHEIVFFEKPVSIFGKKFKNTASKEKIKFFRNRQLIHHKLRLSPFLHHINARFEKAEINVYKEEILFNKTDIIINFNYDYFFLRSLFPQNKIITIINDDFWSSALFQYEKPLRWALKKTCVNSDNVLTVSHPLLDQLREYCQPNIFYPWSDRTYIPPQKNHIRRVLLFWGYVNPRIDFDYVFKLADTLSSINSKFEIHFIGPLENMNNIQLDRINKHDKIRLFPPCSLQEIDFSEVLACFIPYIEGKKENDVTSIPNKMFPMLTNGLPLLITGMPNFIDESFVYRLNSNLDEDIDVISRIDKEFFKIQPKIIHYLEKNSSKSRLNQFLSYL